MASKLKIVSVIAIALSLAVAVLPARASLVGNLINGSNTFQDNSVTYAVAADGTTVLPANATLATGDYLVGVAAISENLSKPAGNQTISGAVDIVFAFQISSAGAPGTMGLGPNQVPIALQDGAASNTILKSLLSGGQFSALPSTDSYAVISSPNAFNVTTLTRTGAGNAFSAINAGYSLDAGGNIGGTPPVLPNFDQVALTVGYSTTSPGNTIGSEQAVLNMNYHPGFNIAGNSSLNELFGPYSLESGDVTLYSPLFVATTQQLANGWAYADNATVTLDAAILPEPTGFAVVGGIFGLWAFGTAAYRRMRKA